MRNNPTYISIEEALDRGLMNSPFQACGNTWETARGLPYHESHCEAFINADLLKSRAEGSHHDRGKGRRKLRHKLNDIWGELSRRKRHRTLSDVETGNADRDLVPPLHVDNTPESSGLTEGGVGPRARSGLGEEKDDRNALQMSVGGIWAIPDRIEQYHGE
jgi:hypothetical protein